jgi:hypothetical protein
MAIIKINLGIVGTRTFSDYELLVETVENVLTELTSSAEGEDQYVIGKIISGGAKGADALAEKYAKENEIETKIYYANWNLHGRKAGPLRNKKIVATSDYVIAFWDGVSRGTKSSIDIATETDTKIKIVNY